MRTLNFKGTRTVEFAYPVEVECGPLHGEIHLEVEAEVFAGEGQTHDHPGAPFEVDLVSVTHNGHDADYTGHEDAIIQEAINRAESLSEDPA